MYVLMWSTECARRPVLHQQQLRSDKAKQAPGISSTHAFMASAGRGQVQHGRPQVCMW